MSTPNIDVLAVGPHPDDVELFCGGTVIRMVQLGHRVAVLDLTAGELASRGTPTVRRAEAEAAAEVMGLIRRDNLGLPDGGLEPGTDDGQVRATVDALRRLRPELVLIPWLEARHPDHAAAGHLLRKAVFMAGLRHYETPVTNEPHRPAVLFYALRHRFVPSFVVDTSLAAELKTKAIQCHQSQVGPTPDPSTGASTLVGSPRALQAIEARDRYYGSFIGVSHGEPFRVEATMGLTDPLEHFRANPFSEAHAFEPLS